jgi:hypothetical protein
LQQNLPVTSVRDIVVHDADLVLATHGRGIFIMDDIGAFRQHDAAVAKATSWLFKPEPAYRVRMPEFTGTPMPKDEPMAANPPLGAYLDYTLKTSSKNPITLDIFDSTGDLIRHYSSADAGHPTDPAKIEIAPEWVRQPSQLATTPGMHRFVWPLRYAAPSSGDKRDPWADGLWAPPGDYRVVLDVDGLKHGQTLRVLPDPRVHLPDSAYAEQFALARRIERQTVRVAAAAHENGALLLALGSIRETKLDGDVGALRERARALAGTHEAPNPHNAWAYPPRDANNFKFLGDALAKLLSAVDGADAAPSVDAQNGYKALASMVDATLGVWDELKSRDLAALNARLKEAGKEQVKL